MGLSCSGGQPCFSFVEYADEANLPYRCLLLDHDDTCVATTAAIHYPAHVESVQKLRPDLTPVTLEGWFEVNHEPGVSKYLTSIFDEEQMKKEHEIWRSYTTSRAPLFYNGIPETLAAFKARGGKIAVISHSQEDIIWQHYREHPKFEEIRPNFVFGWQDDPRKRKPAMWPALQALEALECNRDDCLVVDDLSPGVKMAKQVGMPAAAAGWGHSVPIIEEYMKRECNYYFQTVEDFTSFILGKSPAGRRIAERNKSLRVGAERQRSKM